MLLLTREKIVGTILLAAATVRKEWVKVGVLILVWRNAATATAIVQIATVEASVTVVKVVTLVACIAARAGHHCGIA